MARPGRWNGWSLLGLVAAGVAVECAATLGWVGTAEEGIRTLVRVTARSSALLFIVVFVASASVTLSRGAAPAKWLLRNRRFLGLGFALSHIAHAAAFSTLALSYPTSFSGSLAMSTRVGGTVGYIFVLAMVATSFDRPTAWLGRARWKVLHRTGMYALFLIFLASYLAPAIFEPTLVSVSLSLLLGFAWLTRIAAWVRRRSARSR